MSSSPTAPTVAAVTNSHDDSSNASASPPPATAPEPSPSATVLMVQSEPKECADKAASDAAAHVSEKAPEENHLWYFAIGSMMNPTSLNLRNIFPRRSCPGVLHGWKLVFRGSGGMGDIDEGAPEDNFHGVLHYVTKEEFAHLDSIESIYDRTPVPVTMYDGTVVTAGAYKMNQAKLKAFGWTHDALPGERYLDIIIRGAIHYGIKEDYIAKLRQIPVQPRKKVSEYRLLPTPPDVEIPLAKLQAGKGVKGGEPLRISCNGKVLEWAVDPFAADCPPQVKQSFEWSKNRYAGTEIAVNVCKTLYEPIYPIPTTYDAMLPDQLLWAEELFFGFTRHPTYPCVDLRIGNWQVIGWLEGHRQGR